MLIQNIFSGLKWIGLIVVTSVSLLAGQETKQEKPGIPDAPEGYEWKQIPEYTDEFNGAELDPTKWLPTFPTWKGREPSQFSKENVSVGDGMLRLRSTSRVESLEGITNPEKDVWVDAACVSSKKRTVSYGYYETRMKASRLAMTSSFWMQGRYSEIDVVEQVGGSVKQPEQASRMLMNTHFFPNGFDTKIETPQQWKMPVESAADFHVYGVWWKDKNTVWFYHNGVKVAEVKPGGDFTESMTMYFDTEVFLWEGLPTIESLKDPTKNTMLVDWVRGWRLEKMPEAKQ